MSKEGMLARSCVIKLRTELYVTIKTFWYVGVMIFFLVLTLESYRNYGFSS